MDDGPATQPANALTRPGDMPLLRWVWRSYVRNALIPLLLVELLLVAVYLASHAWSLRRNVGALRDVARQEITRIAADESAIIDERLRQVTALTDVLRRQTAAALARPMPASGDRARLRQLPGGALITDRDDGGAAVFYSARTSKGPAQFERLERLARVDPLLRDVTLANSLIVQAYVNTHDSMTRIWPWIDAAERFDPAINIPDFNFYYEADARRNPSRDVVWTDAYVDPAGHGWLVSAIAPVYHGEFLEAVVGADVRIDSVVAEMLSKEIPWQGFLLLIGKSGTLLALPPRGERLFSLKEVTVHDDVDVIRADTFKPDEFNVYRRRDFVTITRLLRARPEGVGRIDGSEPHLVAWRTIPTVGWRLMSLVPEQTVFGPSRSLNDDLAVIGWIVVGGLVVFYLVYFTFLYRRARVVSRSIAQPLWQIVRMTRRIAVGEYEHALPQSGVREFRHTVGELQRMGRLLGDSNRAREAAEARLTERNQELSAILSLSPDGLVSFDATGMVSETNPSFLAQTGWSREGLIGRSWAEFWTLLSELGAAGEPQCGVATIVRLQRPRPAVLECRVVGAISGAKVAYFRDITQADELDRTRSDFVATAAHELRTPIAVITGYTEYLEATDPPAGDRREILTTMRHHGDQITGMVTELLDLARIEARAGRDFTMIRQPLAPAVRRFVETFRHREDGRVPRMAGDIGDAEAFVDADKFCQALGNVLSNACKYSAAGSPVSVGLVAEDDAVGVEVRDQGEGMDEEAVRRMFDRFYRGESTAGVPGSGLGMSIVKEIMDIHGGRVQVSSRPGQGTTVTLWLPRAALRG